MGSLVDNADGMMHWPALALIEGHLYMTKCGRRVVSVYVAKRAEHVTCPECLSEHRALAGDGQDEARGDE